jgi:hypothetical protein
MVQDHSVSEDTPMRSFSVVLLFLTLGFAASCSGGGSSAPAGTTQNTDQNPPAAGLPEFPPGAGAPESGVLALPGLDGYYLPEHVARGALALAAEADDVPWAEETESLILAEISDLIIPPDTLIAIKCRTTWCGLVVDSPEHRISDLLSPIGDRLGELFPHRLGMASVFIGRVEGGWIAVYIEIVRMV